VAVLSEGADCGMGIYAAARALDLDFIPIAEERYDLVIPDWSLDDPKIRLLLEIIETPGFRETVTALGGYDPSRSGTVEGVWNGSEWE
jgi:molybdate-binding protein